MNDDSKYIEIHGVEQAFKTPKAASSHCAT